MESELILLKRTIAIMSSRLKELEHDYDFIDYNYGDQLRDCTIIKQSQSEKMRSGTRIIPTLESKIYQNFLHDFRYFAYKSGSILDNYGIDALGNNSPDCYGVSAMVNDITFSHGHKAKIRADGKFVYYPSLKFVIQYAILCYVSYYHDVKSFSGINYIIFIHDIYKIASLFDPSINQDTSQSEPTEVTPCNGRSLYNLSNITTLYSFDGVSIDLPNFFDAMRYVTKKIFVGTVLNSYYGKKSKLIDNYYHIFYDEEKTDLGETKKLTYLDVGGKFQNTNLSYGSDTYPFYVIIPKKMKYQQTTDSHYVSKLTNTADLINTSNNTISVTMKNINNKFFQPYYSPNEIFSTDSVTIILPDSVERKQFKYEFELFHNTENEEEFEFGNGDGLESLSFRFTINQIGHVINDKTIFKINSQECGLDHGLSHILFDYNDEIDILKSWFEYQYEKVETPLNRDDYIRDQILNLDDSSFSNTIESMINETGFVIKIINN